MKYLYRFFILCGCVAFTASAMAQKTVKYGDNPAAGKYADIRGFKMYYEVYGKGQPLLFIHGNGGSIKNFSNQIPFFQKNYMVILADSRAQGRSVDMKDSLSYEMMADDLNALLDRLKLKQAYVVGWSDGGIEGLLLAIRHPDKVKKLATTGANLRPDTTALAPSTYMDIISYSRTLADSIAKTGGKPQAKNAYKVNNIMLLQPNITAAQLHTIKVPVLVIGGDREAIPARHTLEIAEDIPKSNLWIIPNSGHSTPVAKAKQFNPIVAEFFSTPYKKREGNERYY